MEEELGGVPIKDIKCPNCRTLLKGRLTEFVLVSFEYSVRPGYRDDEGFAGKGEPSTKHRVAATCYRCDYEWTLKKASQVTDLDKEQTDKE